jgi:hypothetical protein
MGKPKSEVLQRVDEHRKKISKIKTAIWNFVVAVGEAKQERLRKQGYGTWY